MGRQFSRTRAVQQIQDGLEAARPGAPVAAPVQDDRQEETTKKIPPTSQQEIDQKLPEEKFDSAVIHSTDSGDVIMNQTLVFKGAVDTMSGDETFSAGDGNLFVKDPGGSARNFNPSGTFQALTSITLINTADAGEDITFDSGGLAQVVAQNQRGVFVYDGSNWLLADLFSIISGVMTDFTIIAAATYTLLSTDAILHVTYTATAAVAITLPSALASIVRPGVLIKDAGGNAATNNITIQTQGAETIDGSATAVLVGDYDAIWVYSDGSNWFLY